MPAKETSTVRMFGALHTIRKDRGQPSLAEMSIPAGGCPADVLANRLDLPLKKIEAVFINHHIQSLAHHVQPGDRVAFVPKGIPGPARGLLGIFDAGRSNKS